MSSCIFFITTASVSFSPRRARRHLLEEIAGLLGVTARIAPSSPGNDLAGPIPLMFFSGSDNDQKFSAKNAGNPYYRASQKKEKFDRKQFIKSSIYLYNI